MSNYTIHEGEGNLAAFFENNDHLFTNIFIVTHSDNLSRGDDLFLLLEEKNHYFIIPEDEKGFYDFSKELKNQIEIQLKYQKIHFFRTYCHFFPLSWRKKILGIFPLFPVPRFGKHKQFPLPKWEEINEISKEDFFENF